MRHGFWVIGLTLLLVVLTACSSDNQNSTNDAEKDIPEVLEVQLDVPETVKVNDTLKMKATVTQGNDQVADANEVQFEIWEQGKEDDSRMVEANNNKDGTYDGEIVIDNKGDYIVQVHVTARGMHNMPKKTISVME